MPNRGDIQINTFAKGLNTQVSPLSFPPNTALDILNFRIEKNATNVRRLGIDFEDNYLLTATGYAADVLATARKSFYRWEMPNGNQYVEIGVIQIGAKFFFVNLYATSPSNTLLNGGTAVDAGVDPTSRFSFATINNYLLALSPALPQPYLISYNYNTDAITTETAPIKVRDFWGVDDTYDAGERPTTLTPAHHYNLKNQGWNDDIVTTCGAGINAINCTFSTLGIYPSNADHWSIGRIEDLTSADVYKYDPNQAKRNALDVGFIARGHYIIDLYNRGVSRNTATGLTLPADIETGRLSTVAAYAGRAFYAGIKSLINSGDSRSPTFSGTVFFSQVFVNKIDLVKCYQEADPTSIDVMDIVDTDGGIIQIPECSVITKLQAIKESLFVFAQNGIWRIRGDDGGFRATSYQVDKISNVGVYSPDSIVEINGTVYFWGINGIYQLALNQFGVYETTNITIPTIQRLYDSIPDLARIEAKAYYDLNKNCIRWLYYSDEAKIAGEPIESVPAVPIFELGSIATGSSNSGIAVDVTTFDSSNALVIYRETTTNRPKAVPYAISGLTATQGTGITLSTTGCIAVKCCRISATKTLAAYMENNAGNFYIRAKVITLSSGVITAGAEQSIKDLTTAGGELHIVEISETQAIISYYHATSPRNLYARVLDISGDTITLGAELLIDTQTSMGIPYIAILNSTNFLLTYQLGSTIKGVVLTRSSSTLTAGTIYTITTSGAGSSGTMNAVATNTLAVLSYQGTDLITVPLSINGTVITVGTENNNLLDMAQGDGIFTSNSTYVYIYQSSNYPYINVHSVGNSTISNTYIETQLSSSIQPNSIAVTKVEENKLFWVGVASTGTQIYSQLITTP